MHTLHIQSGTSAFRSSLVPGWKKLQKRRGSPHGTESHAAAAQPDYGALAVTSVIEGESRDTHWLPNRCLHLRLIKDTCPNSFIHMDWSNFTENFKQAQFLFTFTVDVESAFAAWRNYLPLGELSCGGDDYKPEFLEKLSRDEKEAATSTLTGCCSCKSQEKIHINHLLWKWQKFWINWCRPAVFPPQPAALEG